MNRFDTIMKRIAGQISFVKEETEVLFNNFNLKLFKRLKDLYMEDYKRIYGRFATDPFAKNQQKKRNIEAFSNLKGMF